MKIFDYIFKIITLLLLTGILLAIAYFGFNGQNEGRYVKFSGQEEDVAILDQKTGNIYGGVANGAGVYSFYGTDLINGKFIFSHY